MLSCLLKLFVGVGGVYNSEAIKGAERFFSNYARKLTTRYYFSDNYFPLSLFEDLSHFLL